VTYQPADTVKGMLEAVRMGVAASSFRARAAEAGGTEAVAWGVGVEDGGVTVVLAAVHEVSSRRGSARMRMDGRLRSERRVWPR
jgi:hypothetical protein